MRQLTTFSHFPIESFNAKINLKYYVFCFSFNVVSFIIRRIWVVRPCIGLLFILTGRYIIINVVKPFLAIFILFYFLNKLLKVSDINLFIKVTSHGLKTVKYLIIFPQ